MVEKCEVPVEEEYGSEGAVLQTPPHPPPPHTHLCFGAEVRMGSANCTNFFLWTLDDREDSLSPTFLAWMTNKASHPGWHIDVELLYAFCSPS